MDRSSLVLSLKLLQTWMECGIASKAPGNDLVLIKATMQYRDNIDGQVGEAALQACGRHTWYLTPELVPLALFSCQLSPQTRSSLAHKLAATPKPRVLSLGKPKLPGLPSSAGQAQKTTLSSFISPLSWTLFGLLGDPDTSWLTKPVSMWNDSPGYREASTFVGNMLCTNDTAERGVKLISDYIGVITKDDEQRQYLLQAIEQHRKLYPDANKSTLFKYQKL